MPARLADGLGLEVPYAKKAMRPMLLKSGASGSPAPFTDSPRRVNDFGSSIVNLKMIDLCVRQSQQVISCKFVTAVKRLAASHVFLEKPCGCRGNWLTIASLRIMIIRIAVQPL